MIIIIRSAPDLRNAGHTGWLGREGSNLRMAVLSSDIGNRTPKETGVAAKYAQVAV
jgi:hypothetical protein